MSNILSQPFGITWRKAMLSAPRLVPDAVLYYTSPIGPHPIVIGLPSSHGNFKIPCYVFVPPSEKIKKAKKIRKMKSSRKPRFRRSASRASLMSVASTATAASSATVDSAEIDKLPVKLPVLIDFHGGGFIFGSCQEQAPYCAQMSREMGAIVISVDYRLGPAAQFPAANHDAEDVLNAILKPGSKAYEVLKDEVNRSLRKASREEIDIDSERIAISGFSSGGNLALNLGLNVHARDYQKAAEKCPVLEKDWPIPFPDGFKREIPLLLFYPSLDCRLLPVERPMPEAMHKAADGPKKKTFIETLRLETNLMPTYLPRHLAGHPRASPGLAPLTGLHKKARIYLVLPELDTLSAQSEVWTEKCKAEGYNHQLQVERVKGVTHGWTQFPETFVEEEHRKLRDQCFQRAKEICEKAWAEETGVVGTLGFDKLTVQEHGARML